MCDDAETVMTIAETLFALRPTERQIIHSWLYTVGITLKKTPTALADLKSLVRRVIETADIEDISEDE